jgi:thioredoxin-like negative regulator of GroEL
MSIPTLLLFKRGQLADSQPGWRGKAQLEQWVTAAV